MMMMKNRILKQAAPILLAGAFLFPLSVPAVSAAEQPKPEWTEYSLIAHAMGGIDGVDYTNSLEAFQENYAKGQRVFEADFTLTEDGQLAARHDWLPYLADKFKQDIPAEKRDVPLTMSEFKSYPILRKYTPLSIDDVASLLKRYPDVYLVTDTKETDPALVQQQFTLIRNAVNKVDPKLINRIVPELYTPSMIQQARDIIPFPNYIYSLYLSELKPDEIVEYVQSHGIRVVAMPSERATPEFIADLKEAGAVAYVHSLNKPDEVKAFLDMGVNGVYTDFLSYKDVGITPVPVASAQQGEVRQASYAAAAGALPAGQETLEEEDPAQGNVLDTFIEMISEIFVPAEKTDAAQ
ncbi:MULTISPECIES: phosphatidylinositol-specific phospholipase C/glycerophosphodiester phosphodiesterase family protein [Paenibacillus]|uniref:phosphatidylinositol-specific phospholipase C/glycerophosphodiester phosphodiesterase family protein n=1 Tax=Paenibacillus TaxID=44249 RepID=UPI0022B8AA25|nr:phosphatidylinositol-specific phospholipase C/glycerophosphodiester phosphodiesterase family protein [Paenibacillus caseinilyticus]MCZ8522509.1 phosphatidylinositol-specific phospholipase C/glycerophosphodiester phosphodiesterase family protein [Paenibacillus caseinilyticus]